MPCIGRPEINILICILIEFSHILIYLITGILQALADIDHKRLVHITGAPAISQEAFIGAYTKKSHLLTLSQGQGPIIILKKDNTLCRHLTGHGCMGFQVRSIRSLIVAEMRGLDNIIQDIPDIPVHDIHG